ncbi:hypothetical protein [Heyndrickxia acidicola]|uniref:DUF3052 domain-containing protein n=1 Tax=Heyndrickxia acidicola TaxID=209389 RepID=A0ABU6ML14_9BACI|nr:hypothetical protein [Heyndrickxia acidicola]MED1203730.1 hypothetical protein [Heyndrickxia acidicola]
MDQEVLKKLRYKEGSAMVLNAPKGYESDISAKDSEGKWTFALLFAHHKQDVEEWLPRILPHIEEDAVFWIAFPKKSSKINTDINRDILAAFLQDQTPFRPVSNVSIDETWSALRFREKEKVKSRKA